MPRKIPMVFYRGASGAEPVRNWLKALPVAERRAIGLDLMRVQWRWPVGMPLCRPMGQGLWEVRCTLPGNRIARVFFLRTWRDLVGSPWNGQEIVHDSSK